MTFEAKITFSVILKRRPKKVVCSQNEQCYHVKPCNKHVREPKTKTFVMGVTGQPPWAPRLILVKGTITVRNTAAAEEAANNANKKVIFRNCMSFTSCISRINNTQVDDAQYIDVVMPMYNIIEYSDNYSKTSGILWQFRRDVPTVGDDVAITDFNDANATDSFNLKEKLTGQTGNKCTKTVEIMIPLKYLRNFWRTLEMPLINCEITLDLNWSENCVIVATNVAAQDTTFSITDIKLYVPVVTLSTQDNAKLLEQLKFGFKRTINWNKYQTKVSTERQNQYLDFLIDSSFQGVNGLFVLSFENETQPTSYKRYYLQLEK